MPTRRPADSGGDEAPPWTQAVQEAYNDGERDPGTLRQIALDAGASATQATQTVGLFTYSPDTPPQSEGAGQVETPEYLDLTSGDQIAVWLTTIPPEQATAWIDQNAGSLDATTAADLQNQLDRMGYDSSVGPESQATIADLDEQASDLETPVVSTPTSPPLSETASMLANRVKTVNGLQREQAQTAEDSIGKAAEAGSQILVTAQQTGQTVLDEDLRSTLEKYMPAGLSPAEQSKWLTEATAAATTTADSAITTSQTEAGQTVTGLQSSTYVIAGGTPRWILEGFGQLSDLQKKRLVEYYNDALGTNFRDYNELLADPSVNLNDQNATNANMVEAAVNAVEPVQDLRIELPGRQDAIHLSVEDQAQLRESYGLNTDGITRLARLANLTPYKGTDGKARTVDLYGLAALASYYQMQSGLDEQNDRDQKVRQLQDRIDEIKGRGGREGDSAETQGLLREYQRQITELKMMNGPTSGAAAQSRNGYNRPGLLGIQYRYNQGLDQYRQNQTLATIHVVDPALAQRITRNGIDPTKLSPTDNAAAWDILIRSGAYTRDKRSGFRPDDPVLAAFAGYFDLDPNARGGGGGGGGGAGPVRRLIDKETIRARLRDEMRTLFDADAPDSLVDEMHKSLQGALDKAPQGMEFDISSRIDSWLQGLPIYQKLYHNKPAGLSEGEYKQQFVAGASSILGAQTADPQTIHAGMQTGQYQTTVGAAAVSEQAKENSTWMERLARAANTVAANT